MTPVSPKVYPQGLEPERPRPSISKSVPPKVGARRRYALTVEFLRKANTKGEPLRYIREAHKAAGLEAPLDEFARDFCTKGGEADRRRDVLAAQRSLLWTVEGALRGRGMGRPGTGSIKLGPATVDRSSSGKPQFTTVCLLTAGFARPLPQARGSARRGGEAAGARRALPPGLRGSALSRLLAQRGDSARRSGAGSRRHGAGGDHPQHAAYQDPPH